MKRLYILLFLVAAVAGSSAQEQKDPSTDPCSMFVPATLTANGPDELKITIGCPVSSFSFQLFNRWGMVVYSTDKLSIPLDFNMYEKTKVNGKEEARYPTGSYYWTASYELTDKNTKKMSGTLTIIAAH